MTAGYVGTPYNPYVFNCATFVCSYFRDKGIGSLPDGDLAEYTYSGILWIKNNFKRIPEVEKDCLILCKQADGRLHAAVYDGKNVLHASEAAQQVISQPLWLFLRDNKNERYYKWRS